MAVPDRELVITYGGYSVGGSTGRHIGTEKIRIEDSFDRGAVEFVVVLTSDTQANLATACLALEAAYRDPYGTLSITMGGQTLLNFDADEALEAMPTVTKEGSEFDTGLSRAYRVRIEYQRPADNVPNSGLRSRAVSITYTPARRRTVTISGMYTAVSGTDARAKYQASIASLATTVLSAIDGAANWELVNETDGPSSTNDKWVEFSRSYEEVIFSQAGSADSAAIVQQSLRIKLRDIAPGDTPDAERLSVYEATYSAWIDKDQSTDLAAQWATIYPWLVTQVRTNSNASQVAVVDKAVDYDFDDNRINATVLLHAVTGGDVIENAVTVEDDDEKGLKHLPVWSGSAFARLEYQGPREYMRTVRVRTVCDGERTVSFARDHVGFIADGFNQSPSNIGQGEWRTMRPIASVRIEERGLEDGGGGSTITLSYIEGSVVMKWVEVVTGSPGVLTPGGGGGPTTP